MTQSRKQFFFFLVDQRNERSLVNACSIVFFPRYIKSLPSNMWIRIKYTHYIINLKGNLLYIISIYIEGYAFLSFISWFLVIPSESQLFLQALCDKEALLAPWGRQQQSQQYSLQNIRAHLHKRGSRALLFDRNLRCVSPILVWRG